jgi:protein-arginine kinase activator protein McsA
MQTERERERERVRKKYEEQSRAVQLNQKKPEVRSEVCNLCSVVTETFGVLSLFGVTQCYSYSEIKSVIINCNSAWQIPNKSSIKSRTHKIICRVTRETRDNIKLNFDLK